MTPCQPGWARARPRFDAARRPKRTPKVPRNSARRGGALPAPVQVERFLGDAIAKMAKRFAQQVRAIVLPRVADFARPPPERTDAKGPNDSAAKVLAGQMRSAASRSFSQQAIRSVTEQAARRIESHSKGQFKKLGIKVEKEPALGWLVKGWTKDVAERVSAMGKAQVSKLEAILSKGFNRHVDSIAKDIEEQLGVTESRAEFLAKDSILTLNSKISRERLRGARVEQYIWTTMGDDRVREEHEALDGETFSVDGGGAPGEGHPGEPPNCRCVQYPLIPDDANVEPEED